MAKIIKIKRYYKYIILYYLLYSFIYTGFLLYRCAIPDLFQYSKRYLLVLIGLSLFFFLPLFVILYKKIVGSKGLRYSVILVAIFLCILYVVFSTHYYYTQTHSFDPFLQMPPARFEGRFSKEKKEDTFRILCLGGSTTQVAGFSSEKSYPSALQTILKDYYPTVKVEVLNAGMGWYTTKHSLINYVTYCSDWKPDLVIIMHGINDLVRSFAPAGLSIGKYNELWSHFYGPSIKGAKPPAFLEHLFSELFDSWYSELRLKEVDYPLEKYVSIKMFERHLKKLVGYAQSDNAKVILITQPYLYKENMDKNERRLLWIGRWFCYSGNFLRREYPSNSSMARAMNAFSKTTKKVAFQEGAMLVDADLIAKNLQNFYDDVHYTEEGARLLAGLVADKIIKEDIIKEKTSIR